MTGCSRVPAVAGRLIFMGMDMSVNGVADPAALRHAVPEQIDLHALFK